MNLNCNFWLPIPLKLSVSLSLYFVIFTFTKNGGISRGTWVKSTKVHKTERDQGQRYEIEYSWQVFLCLTWFRHVPRYCTNLIHHRRVKKCLSSLSHTYIGAKFGMNFLRLFGLVMSRKLVQNGSTSPTSIVVVGWSFRVQIAIGITWIELIICVILMITTA